MAWHLGYPLSQTVFSNVYVDAILNPAPSSIRDAQFIRDPQLQAGMSPMHSVLRAYCLGLLKACWYVNERIKFEHYYEVISHAQWFHTLYSFLPRKKTSSPTRITGRYWIILTEKTYVI